MKFYGTFRTTLLVYAGTGDTFQFLNDRRRYTRVFASHFLIRYIATAVYELLLRVDNALVPYKGRHTDKANVNGLK